jgi:hypothetical protein
MRIARFASGDVVLGDIERGHWLLHVSADDPFAGGEQVQLFDQVETLEFEVEIVVLEAFELEVIGSAFAFRSAFCMKCDMASWIATIIATGAGVGMTHPPRSRSRLQ